MAFSIIVQNDGEAVGTIEVNERLSLNETIQVFNAIIEAGGSRQWPAKVLRQRTSPGFIMLPITGGPSSKGTVNICG